jgi:hypothetical protein
MLDMLHQKYFLRKKKKRDDNDADHIGVRQKEHSQEKSNQEQCKITKSERKGERERERG